MANGELEPGKQQCGTHSRMGTTKAPAVWEYLDGGGGVSAGYNPLFTEMCCMVKDAVKVEGPQHWEAFTCHGHV